MRQLILLLLALALLVLTVLGLFWPFLGSDSPTPALLAHQGELRTVCGKVDSAYYARHETGEPTFLNLGGKYPHQWLTVVIWGKHRERFEQPEISYLHRTICVTGVIEVYEGKAEFAVEGPRLIQTFESPLTLGVGVLGTAFSVVATILIQDWLQRGARAPEAPAGQEPVRPARGLWTGGFRSRFAGRRGRWILALLVVGALATAAASWLVWR
jgi:hypothetical protein